MISSSAREEISRYLGSEPRRYVIPSIGGEVETECECWDLRPLKDEEKPVHVRYQDIVARVARLMEADPHDPQIEPLVKQANEIVRRVHTTKQFGAPVITMHELLKLDQWKGIRQEWWELRGSLTRQTVCIFQGYGAMQAGLPGSAELLIAMPGQDQYEFLRIHRTRGNNHLVETEQIIASLSKLGAEYGVTIVSASADSVEFVLDRPVEAASMRRIRQRLKRLCPSAEAITEGIRLGRVALWWD